MKLALLSCLVLFVGTISAFAVMKGNYDGADKATESENDTGVYYMEDANNVDEFQNYKTGGFEDDEDDDEDIENEDVDDGDNNEDYGDYEAGDKDYNGDFDENDDYSEDYSDNDDGDYYDEEEDDDDEYNTADDDDEYNTDVDEEYNDDDPYYDEEEEDQYKDAGHKKDGIVRGHRRGKRFNRIARIYSRRGMQKESLGGSIVSGLKHAMGMLKSMGMGWDRNMYKHHPHHHHHHHGGHNQEWKQHFFQKVNEYMSKHIKDFESWSEKEKWYLMGLKVFVKQNFKESDQKSNITDISEYREAFLKSAKEYNKEVDTQDMGQWFDKIAKAEWLPHLFKKCDSWKQEHGSWSSGQWTGRMDIGKKIEAMKKIMELATKAGISRADLQRGGMNICMCF